MYLSDRDIREAMQPAVHHNFAGQPSITDSLGIEPMPADDCFQPASVELTLDGHMRDFGGNLKSFDRIYLREGHTVLLSTAETVTIPHWMLAQVDGKSTLARQFVQVHMTAGYIDPGFTGQITLEVVNLSPHTVTLTAGMKICQLRFAQLTSTVMRPYGHPELGSHYQGQTGPTPAATNGEPA